MTPTLYMHPHPISINDSTEAAICISNARAYLLNSYGNLEIVHTADGEVIIKARTRVLANQAHAIVWASARALAQARRLAR
jgi:hypothetical protein